MRLWYNVIASSGSSQETRSRHKLRSLQRRTHLWLSFFSMPGRCCVISSGTAALWFLLRFCTPTLTLDFPRLSLRREPPMLLRCVGCQSLQVAVGLVTLYGAAGTAHVV